MTQAVIFTIENRLFEYLYNVGTDTEVSIKNLVQTVQKIIGYKGTIVWDDTKPDRTLRKLMNLSKLKSIGWEATALPFSIQNIYNCFLLNQKIYTAINLYINIILPLKMADTIITLTKINHRII